MSDVVISRKLSKFAWFVTVFNILVIAWGAMVRATGSGAGCGSHWPQCNGALIPGLAQADLLPIGIETMIEFSHRISSALAGILVIILVVAVFCDSRARVARKPAIGSIIFIVLEGFLGALLVRLELVAQNASVLRAVMVALHLVNTLLLLTMLGLTARFCSDTEHTRNDLADTASAIASEDHAALTSPRQRLAIPVGLSVLLFIGLIVTALLCAAGAVTALGDTLFPAQSLAAGLNIDLDPAASFIVRLRVIHPFIAVLASAYLLLLSQVVRNAHATRPTIRLTYILIALVITQLGAGVVNVLLLAPLWMQVLHLVLADVVWLVLVMLTAEIVWMPTLRSPHPVNVSSQVR